MDAGPDRPAVSLGWLPPAAGIVVMLVACLTLLGWMFDIEALKSVVPGLVTMKANTAFGFLLLGAALVLDPRGDQRAVRILTRISAILVILMCGLTLVEYTSGRQLGLDELVFTDVRNPVATSHPGRMAVNTAVTFLLLTGALLSTEIRWRTMAVHEALALTAGGVTLTALVGNLYGVPSFAGLVPYTHMAVHTVTAFLVLVTGILFVRPGRGLAGLTLSTGAGGVAARRLLPMAVAVPIVLGWLRLRGERAGYYRMEFGLSLMVIVTVAVFLMLGWGLAAVLRRADRTRARAAAELARAHERLRILHDIDLAIIAETAPVAIAEAVLQRLRDLLEVPRAIVNLFDWTAGEVEWLAAVGRHRLHEGPRVRYSMALAGDVEALRRGEPQVIDVQALPPSPEAEALLASGVTTYMVVPMIAGGELIGSVSFGGEQAHFPEAQVSIAQEVAAQLAIALRQARLVEAVRTSYRELQETQAQLLQAQKMEAIGQLAGGVAHDFNNLLTVITGRTHLTLSALPADHPHRRNLELIETTAQRAAALTRQLLTFSRKQVLEPKVLDLNAVVAGLAPMLSRLIGEHLELTTAPAPDLWRVKADPTQLEQVIVNLAVNARDAMPQGGRLTIETANVELDDAHVRRHPGATSGPFVLLAVADTGHGMDAATQARIFEPFFTTKEAGKGTGLGLATVFGIVKQSGGNIWVFSEPGQGTTFKVYLPRADTPD